MPMLLCQPSRRSGKGSCRRTGITEIEFEETTHNGIKSEEVSKSLVAVHEKSFNFDDTVIYERMENRTAHIKNWEVGVHDSLLGITSLCGMLQLVRVFIITVQRGAAIIKGTWVSMGVYSDGSYGVPIGLIYALLVTCFPWREVTELMLKNVKSFTEKHSLYKFHQTYQSRYLPFLRHILYHAKNVNLSGESIELALRTKIGAARILELINQFLCRVKTYGWTLNRSCNHGIKKSSAESSNLFNFRFCLFHSRLQLTSLMFETIIVAIIRYSLVDS